MPSTTNTTLRHFTDLEDLFDSTENELILKWVNELNEVKERQRDMGKRYRTRQQAFAKVARQLLDPDEVKRVLDAAAGEGEVE